MRHVGNKIAPYTFKPHEFRYVVEYGHGTHLPSTRHLRRRRQGNADRHGLARRQLKVQIALYAPAFRSKSFVVSRNFVVFRLRAMRGRPCGADGGRERCQGLVLGHRGRDRNRSSGRTRACLVILLNGNMPCRGSQDRRPLTGFGMGFGFGHKFVHGVLQGG